MTKPLNAQEKNKDIISEIDKNYTLMKSLRPLPEVAFRRYQEEFDVLSSFYSNAVEGNTFTYDETRLLIKEGITIAARTMREHNDIVGHSKAYWSLYEALKQKKEINEKFILDLHYKVLQGDDYAGRYRDANVYIGDTITIAYTAPSAQKVPELMQEYVTRLDRDIKCNMESVQNKAAPDWYKLFYNLAEHHISFEKIHPFFDGNGRTGRLLLNYELLSIGLLPLNITTEDRSQYYSAFKSVEGKQRYSTKTESKYEKMAKLLARSELRSMQAWNNMFEDFIEKN